MEREVYIVGGGQSLKGYNFNHLKDKDTIAVNVSALDVPNPTYCITADSSIFRKVQEGYFKDVNTTWVLVTNPEHCSMKFRDGKFVHKNGFVYNLFCMNIVIRNAGIEGIGFTFSDFRTGYNSGFCALQLAVLLGYDKIHLLGFDLIGMHYHKHYSSKQRIAVKTFEKFYQNFVLALGILKTKTNIKVISHSAVSRLNAIIPYKSLREIV